MVLQGVASIHGACFSRRSAIPAHQEVLEEEQAQLDHTDDVLPRCRCIMEIVCAGIDDGIFHDGFGVRRILDVIMAEAHGALLYQRHRRRIEEIEGR